MSLVQRYDLKVVKYFIVMASIYLVIGTTIGVYIASELAWPFLNDLGTDLPYFQFGRLRPLHTNIVIFAFGGSALAYLLSRTGVQDNDWQALKDFSANVERLEDRDAAPHKRAQRPGEPR